MDAFLRLQKCRFGSSLHHLVILLGIEKACLSVVVPLQIEYVL